MRDLIKMITGALFAAAVPAFMGISVMGQDPVKVDAKHYKVEFENDRVRVLRASYGPKEKSVMHQHPEGVAISLGEMQGKFTGPDGKSEDRSFKSGEIRWTPAETHLPENTGGKPFTVILIELKGGGKTDMPASAEDPAKADAKHYKVELENERVRVLRVNVGPREKTPTHGHPSNVVVFLTDGRMRFTLPDGKTTDAEAKAGQVMWDPAGMHAGESLSDKPFAAIVVELKGQ